MKTAISAKALNAIETPLLALIVAQGAMPSLDAILERAVSSGDYKGKKDETLLVYGGGKVGLMGIVAGVGLSYGVTQFLQWPTDVTVQSIVMSFGVAAATGVFFGFYPARKAAGLNPIEALRYE